MAIGSDTLKRTPLYDRHVAAGAKLVPFAGWEMPVQYAGIKDEHLAVREQRRDLRRLPHGRDRDDRARTPRLPAADPLQRRDARSPSTARSTASSARRTAASSTTSSPTGSTTTASSRSPTRPTTRRTSRGSSKQAERFDVTLHDRLHDYAMLAVQGPEARGIVAGLTDGELPKRFRTATLTVAGAPDVLVCGTGYTGEDGVELLVAPERAPPVWDALRRAPASRPPASARATRCAWRSAYHLYGNDLMETRGPIEAGLGWCVKEDTGFIGAEAIKVARERGPSELLVPFVHRARASPARATPIHRRRRGHLRHAVARRLNVGIGMAYVPVDKAEPGTQLEIDVRGRTRAAEVRAKPLYSKET